MEYILTSFIVRVCVHVTDPPPPTPVLSLYCSGKTKFSHHQVWIFVFNASGFVQLFQSLLKYVLPCVYLQLWP